MTGEWQIGNDVEGSGYGLILRYYPGICLEDQGKPPETSVRIGGLWAKVWTQDLLIMKRVNHSTMSFGNNR
jgi:hypothetical protein